MAMNMTMTNEEEIIVPNDIMVPDCAAAYRNMLNQYPCLDEKTTRELALRKGSDPDARAALINANLRLVLYVVNMVNRRGVDYMDLVQAGNIGLIMGIDKYDPYKYDTALSTCVIPWIQQAVSRHIRNTCSSIRIPIETAREIDKLLVFRSKYYNEHLSYPTDEYCAEHMGISVKKVKNYLLWSNPVSSLDTEMDKEDSDSTTIMDMISSSNENESSTERSGSDAFENILNKEVLLQAFKALTPREKIVITERYGLDGKGERTLSTLAEELSLTRESIRQIQNKALKKMKKALSEDCR